MKQEVLIFPGAIRSLMKLISKYPSNDILLVRGNKSYIKSGLKESIATIFSEYQVMEFFEFSVNPKIEEVHAGYEMLKKKKSPIIIAAGGGSVIDTAKLIKYLAIQEKTENNSIPIIAIPTTAGTGSESTHFAVVYIDGVKSSYADDALMPDYAIVDVNLLKGLSKYQMAVSGIDALSQGIESYWSVNSTEESLQYAADAIRLIRANLLEAINGDKEAQIKLSEGSNWAGKAINISKTTAPHALSYGFTSEFGLPHGHAVALFLPYFISFHKALHTENCADIRGAQFVIQKLVEISELMSTNLDNLESTIKSILRSLDIETDFRKLNISKERFLSTVSNFNRERLNNNPGIIKSDDFISIYNYNTIHYT